MKDEDKTKWQLIGELVELRRRVSELEALEAEREKQTILDSLVENVVYHDMEMRVLWANRAACESAGMTLGELIGCHCYEVWARRSDPCEECPVQRAWRNGRPEAMEKTGSDGRSWYIRGTPVRDSRGDIVGMVELTLKITDRKRAEQEARESTKKLKHFAYSVLHDLKSPAVGIYGLTERLQRECRQNLDARARNYCDQILRAAVHIAAPVEKINVYIATEEAPLTVENVSVGEVLRMVRDEFSARLAVRQIRWVVPEAEIEVRADRLSMVRIFTNLVDNALKYGGQQLSEIRVGYEEAEGFHIFSVRDNGAGIRGGDYKRIFALFGRDKTSKATPGAGLGLAIVSEIAARHKGRVWVEPGRDKATTFYVSLAKDL
ncbi:MAG: ATP-binding protein [Syntrophobacteria bacterium]